MGTVKPKKLGRPRADGGELTETQKDLVRCMQVSEGLYKPEPSVMRLKSKFEAGLKDRPISKQPEELTMRDIAKVCGLSSETVAKVIGSDLRAIDYIVDRSDVGQQEHYLWQLALKRMESILLLGDDKVASNLIKTLAEINRRFPDKSTNFSIDTKVLNMSEDQLKTRIQAMAAEQGLLQAADVSFEDTET